MTCCPRDCGHLSCLAVVGSTRARTRARTTPGSAGYPGSRCTAGPPRRRGGMEGGIQATRYQLSRQLAETLQHHRPRRLERAVHDQNQLAIISAFRATLAGGMARYGFSLVARMRGAELSP